ncbi:MAG: hypothetical protein J5963_04060, partial [Schwartzia sp.]|nr:hypothetical protein [Schwartzia sp. (in: firmicutes)]
LRDPLSLWRRRAGEYAEGKRSFRVLMRIFFVFKSCCKKVGISNFLTARFIREECFQPTFNATGRLLGLAK